MASMFPKDVPCLGLLPNVSQKATDLAQNIVNQSNNAITWGEKMMINDFWWIGRNGKFYLTSLLDGPQRYVYNHSYLLALKEVKNISKATTTLGVASITLDGVEIVLDREVKPSNMINTFVVSLAFAPGLEWVPIVYGIADITTLVITGQSLGDMADNYWGPIVRY